MRLRSKNKNKWSSEATTTTDAFSILRKSLGIGIAQSESEAGQYLRFKRRVVGGRRKGGRLMPKYRVIHNMFFEEIKDAKKSTEESS